MKPDYKLSDKIVNLMQREGLTYGDIAAQAKTSFGTIKDYAEKKEVGKWHDSIVARVAAVLNKYELKWAADADMAKGKKLQAEADEAARKLRRTTVYKRAKMVHAIMASNVLTEEEKQEYVPQFME